MCISNIFCCSTLDKCCSYLGSYFREETGEETDRLAEVSGMRYKKEVWPSFLSHTKFQLLVLILAREVTAI